MADCCCAPPPLNPDPHRGNLAYRRVLWAVLAINAVMFLIEIAAGSPRHLVRVDVREDARDPLAQVIEGDPLREELRLSHFSTDGGFTRAFSALAADEPSNSVELPWDAPWAAPEGGQLVRFWFVLRDLRGGSSFVSRALCVVP